ncbi:hypothetical protein GTA51_18910 [Desulfovibrio aerotolerans]|uniref:Uncharacterized protein n=1 Tax=Solidesulfovibrio aerotolerans TaxID=295255 RepID=A0A7C9MN84_9BACT|nr:hypothetical protein [Solidesulfovibrio aerotolerans]MYL85173.1 hypothetical protein [Solidesulfovibrio aerotolerans]
MTTRVLLLAPGYFSQSAKIKTVSGVDAIANDWSLVGPAAYRRGNWSVDGRVDQVKLE